MSRSQRLSCRVFGGVLALVVIVALSTDVAHAALVTTVASPVERNDGPYSIGYEFTVGTTPYTINALGVYDMTAYDGGAGGGLESAHTVDIWNATTNAVVATASVTAGTAGSATNYYRYAMLSSPITLTAGQAYYISTYIGGGGANDYFYDGFNTTEATANADITLNAAMFNGSGSLAAPNEPLTPGGDAAGRWCVANATFIAPTSTWNGNGTYGYWSTAANWSGSVTPSAGNALDFGGTLNLAATNDLAANTQFAGITFDSTAGAFTLSGNAINLTGDVVNDSTATQTIGANLVLDSNSRTFNTAAGNMLVSGAISQANGTANGLYKTGTGTLTLSGGNTYGGPTTISGGVLSISGSANLGNGSTTNTIAISGGTLDSSANSYSLASNQTITLNGAGTIQTDAGALTISGSMSNGSNPLTVQGAGNTILSGGIGSGSGGLTKNGAGALTLSGSSLGFTGGLSVSNGTVNVSNNTATNSIGLLTVGNVNSSANTATVSVSSGNFCFNGPNPYNAVGGSVAGARGVLNISGGSVTNAGWFMIGSENGSLAGAGVVNQSGGVFNLGGNGSILAWSGYGAYLLSNGTLTGNPSNQFMSVGQGGEGLYSQSGGSASMASNFYLGQTSGTGIADISGGTLTHTSGFFMTTAASGILSVRGSGLLQETSGNFYVAAGGTGIVNLLSGGTIVANQIRASGGATTINFDGGTLAAYSTNAGANFLAGLNNAFVYPGGLTVNNSGTNITIGQALTAPAGYGIGVDGSTIAVSAGGSGYIAPPVVTFAAPTSGVAATGVAVLNGGTVAGIIITSPGSGYTSGGTVAVTFNGGTDSTTNASVTAATPPTVTASTQNTSGGLTFQGGGITTLSSANTYAGGTTVSGGTLQLSNALALQSSTFNSSGLGTLSFGTLTTATLGGLAGSNSLTLPNNFTLSVGNNSSTFSGALGGSGSLTKVGAGALVLSGSNTYSGATTISAGTLQAVSPSAIPGALTVNGGVLQTMGNNYGFTASNLSFTSGGIQNGSATTNVLVTAGADGSSATYAGTLANGGAATLSLLKTGSGNLTFTGVETYTGGTTIGGGTLQVANAMANGTTLTVNNGTLLLSYQNPWGGTGTTVAFNINSGGLMTTDSAHQANIGPLTLSGGTLGGSNSSGTWWLNNGATATGGTVSTLSAQNMVLNGANAAADTFTVNAGATLNVSGSFFQTTGSLTKAGPGPMILAGANTYAGGTSVNTGALYVNGSLSTSSSVTVAGGATLGGLGSVGTTTVQNGGTIEGGYGGVGVLTLSNLTFSNSATVNLTPDSIPAVNVAGSLTASGGSGSVVINVGTQSLNAGDYPLIGYSGAIGGAGFGAFTLGTKPADSNIYTLKDITGGSSYLDLFVAINAPYWSGANGTAWDARTVNWQVGGAGGSPSTYSNGLPVVFDDSAGTNGAVAINGADVAPASVIFNNSALAYTLQGTNAITGSTGLTKGGTGTLTIANVNSFTGAVSFNGGTISVGTLASGGVNSPLGAGTSLAFNSGTLEYTGTDAAPAIDRAITLNSAGGAFQVDTPGTMLTLSGSIGGIGGLTKSGPGSLTLSNSTNSFTGGVTISGGTLAVVSLPNSGVNSYLGAGSSMALGGGGMLEYTGTDAAPGTNRSFTLNTGGGIVQVDNAATGLTLSGAISGNGGLTLAGNGMLLLSAANSYGGGTTVSGGTLQISADSNLGATGTGVTMANGVTLNVNGTGITASRPITLGSGGGTINNLQPAYGLSLSGVISGSSLTVAGGNVILAPSSGTNSVSSLTLASGPTYIQNQNALGTASITVASGAIFDVYGGSLSPSNTMTFASGSGVACRAGTLTLSTADALVPTSGTLNCNTNETAGAVAIGGNYPVLTGGMTFNVAANALTLNGALSDNGNGSLTKTGGGTLVLAGSNSYSGGTTISAGYLQTVNPSAIPGTLTINGGVLQSMGNNYSFNATNLAFTSGYIENGSATTSAIITVGADNSSAAYGGSLANGAAATLALTKAGSGTLTLNGASSSYTGGTTVNGGTLAVNAASAIPNGTALTINNGGYVSLAYYWNAVAGLGSITINSGGTLSADGSGSGGQAQTLLSSTGTLNMNGGVLAGNGVYSTTFGQYYLPNGATIHATGTTPSTISGVLGINSYWQLMTVNVDAGADLLVSGRLLGNNGGAFGGINKTGNGTLDLSNPLNATNPSGGVALTGVTLTAGTVSFVGGGLGSGVGGNAAPSLLADFAGNATLTWDTGNTQDISASSKLKIEDGAVATFNTGGNNVTLGTALVLGTLKSGGLAKAGNGTLTLGGSNSYSGGNTVSGGVLQMGNACALGASTGNLTANAGTLDLAGYSPSVGGLGGAAGTILTSSAASSTLTAGVTSGTATFGGTIANGAGTVALVLGGPGTQIFTGSNAYTGGTTINTCTLQLGDGLANNGSVTGNVLDNGVLTFANYALQTFAGAISGTGALNAKGPAMLTLTASNSVSGTTTISGGTLQLGDGVGNIGSVAGNISDNAVLTFANYAPQTYAGSISGAGALNVNGPATLTLTGNNSAFTGITTINAGPLVFANATAENFASAIGGSGGVLVNTADVLTLSASNGYSGGTTIDGGTLLLGNNNALGAGPVLIAGGQLDLGSFSLPLASLTLASGTLTSSNGGTVNAPVVKNTTGTAYLNGTGLLNGTSLSVTDGQLILGSPQSANGLSITGGSLAGSTLTVAGTSPIDAQGGVISTNLAGGAGLNKTSANTVLLSGNNSYTGGTSVEDGTLQLGSATALPTGSNLTVNAGTLDLDGQNPTVAGVAGVGVGVISNSSTAAATINVSGTAPRMGATLADGNGTTGLIKSGNGTLVLASSANSYSGGTTVSGGVLQVGGAAALGSSNGALEVDAGTLDLAGNSPTVGALAGAAGIVTSSVTGATLTAGSGGGSSAFGGVIVDGAGPVALVKAGSGTLTLGGVNTYGGGTTVGGGVLSISNLENLGTGPLTLGAGTLQTTASVAVDAARTITLAAPAGGIDVPGFQDTFTLNGQVTGTGGLNKTGAGALALANSGALANNYTGDTNVAAGTLLVQADNALSPASNLVIGDGASVILNFGGSVGNDSVTFTGGVPSLAMPALAAPALPPAGISTVPEPGTLVLLLVGALASLVVWRRRSR